MEFDRDSSAGYLVNHMGRLFARQLEAGIRPLGLAIGAFPALLHLWDEDGLTQKDLVERLGIEQPTMAATLQRMERDGLIARQRDAGDARVQRIRLTEHAKRLYPAAAAHAAGVNAAALSVLSEAEQAQFLEMMRRVIRRLAQEDAPEDGPKGAA